LLKSKLNPLAGRVYQGNSPTEITVNPTSGKTNSIIQNWTGWQNLAIAKELPERRDLFKGRSDGPPRKVPLGLAVGQKMGGGGKAHILERPCGASKQ